MAGINAFVQRGNTRRFTAAPWPAPSAIRMSTAGAYPPADNYIITNFGPSVAFVGYAGNSADAITNAQIPTAGGSGRFCFIVPPGQRTLEAQDAVYFAAVTESGTADLLITPGKGSIESDSDTESTQQVDASSAAILLYESVTQQELMRNILVELRTQTEFLKQGLNVADDPDLIRDDQTEFIN